MALAFRTVWVPFAGPPENVDLGFVVCKGVRFLAIKKCYIVYVLATSGLASSLIFRWKPPPPTSYPILIMLATTQAV